MKVQADEMSRIVSSAVRGFSRLREGAWALVSKGAKSGHVDGECVPNIGCCSSPLKLHEIQHFSRQILENLHVWNDGLGRSRMFDVIQTRHLYCLRNTTFTETRILACEDEGDVCCVFKAYTWTGWADEGQARMKFLFISGGGLEGAKFWVANIDTSIDVNFVQKGKVIKWAKVTLSMLCHEGNFECEKCSSFKAALIMCINFQSNKLGRKRRFLGTMFSCSSCFLSMENPWKSRML